MRQVSFQVNLKIQNYSKERERKSFSQRREKKRKTIICNTSMLPWNLEFNSWILSDQPVIPTEQNYYEMLSRDSHPKLAWGLICLKTIRTQGLLKISKWSSSQKLENKTTGWISNDNTFQNYINVLPTLLGRLPTHKKKIWATFSPNKYITIKSMKSRKK